MGDKTDLLTGKAKDTAGRAQAMSGVARRYQRGCWTDGA